MCNARMPVVVVVLTALVASPALAGDAAGPAVGSPFGIIIILIAALIGYFVAHKKT